MKIHWNENPLKTTVELDDTDREKILIYIQKEMYEDILCDLDAWINEEIGKDISTPLKQVQEKIQIWNEICDMNIDHEKVKVYEKYLKFGHGGDCTCTPCTCVQCLAEEALGINTIKGLSSPSAYMIMNAFGDDKTINEAIEKLSKKPSYEKYEIWKNYTQEEYEKYILRWESERKEALKWLKDYKEKHDF